MTVRPFDIEQELLHAVRQLPAARVPEVLDFAYFLASKDPAPANGGEQTPNVLNRLDLRLEGPKLRTHILGG